MPAVVEVYVGSASLDDCGNLQSDLSGFDMATWQAGATCALDHAAQQHPFIVRWYARA